MWMRISNAAPGLSGCFPCQVSRNQAMSWFAEDVGTDLQGQAVQATEHQRQPGNQINTVHEVRSALLRCLESCLGKPL